jgi:Na+/proline symporter
MFLPFSPAQCALAMFAVATIYTMFSGFYGVVVTDLFQAAIIVVSAITITAFAAGQLAGIDSLSELAMSVTGNHQWTSAIPQLHTPMPQGYEQYESLTLFACLYVLRNLIFGLGAGDDPKYFGARSDSECSKLSLLWTCLMSVRWPMMMGFAVLGLILVNRLFPDPSVFQQTTSLIQQHIPTQEHDWATVVSSLVNDPMSQPAELTAGLAKLLGADWQSKLMLVGFHGSVNPERIMPAVLLFDVPQGFRGLMLVALAAASMSTFDSWVNQTTGLFVRDIYQKHLRPKAKVQELMAASWIFIIALVGTGFFFAYSVKSINDVWGWIIMSLGGGLMVPLLLRFYWWRFNGPGFAIGMIVGMAAAIAQRLVAQHLSTEWEFLASENWSLLIIGLIGLVASIIGSLLTAPTPEPVLRNFYFTTLPFGAWSRFKRDLPDELGKRVSAEHSRDIRAVPFALVFQIMIFLTPMLAVIGNWQDAIICFVFACISFAGLYSIWLRRIGDSDAIASAGRRLATNFSQLARKAPDFQSDQM